MIYEVGKYYLVPCVYRRHPSWAKDGVWIPVLGHAHDDPEINKAIGKHWHIDYRFISKSYMREHVGEPFQPKHMGRIVRFDEVDDCESLRRRKCVREMPEFPLSSGFKHNEKSNVVAAAERLCADKKINPDNPVCPHRGIPLSGLPEDEEGCVVCPGHGVKWSLKTGEMVIR